MKDTSRRQPRHQVVGSSTPQCLIPNRLTGWVLRGLLFIGDPHVASYNPGRRMDPSYLDTVLGKLGQCSTWTKERQLLPVSPGDLLDDPDDRDPVMLYRLTGALQQFEPPLVITPGNHDLGAEKWLTEKSVLSLLGLTRTVDLAPQPGFWGRVHLTAEDGRSHRLVVGFTPYGEPLPASLAEAMGLPATTSVDVARAQAEADTVLWITHGDFAFEGAYPGAAPLVAIPGVDLVVNGHMHGAKKPVKVGDTVWYNPGNIVRMSVDMADEAPAAWAWSPFDTETMPAVSGVRVPRLERLELRHASGASTFNFEGLHAPMALLAAEVTPVEDASRSLLFTEQMRDVRADLQGNDPERMREDLHSVMSTLKTPDPARQVIDALTARVMRVMREGEPS
jgi:hypothetical protein